MSPADLVTAHIPLVQSIAWRMSRSLPMEIDDLTGLGMVGLVQAAQRYDAGTGYSFAAFAHSRVRGAMVDGARAAIGRGRGPAYLKHQLPAGALDRLDDPRDRPDAKFDAAALMQAVRAAVATLPRNQRIIVEQADLGGEKILVAGRRAGAGKSWASRLRRAALDALRDKLADWDEAGR